MLLSIGYMGLIYRVSSIPGTLESGEDSLHGLIAWTPPALQNLLHVPVFALLAWLWHRTLRPWLEPGMALNTAVIALAAGYGILDELHQLQVPGRYASLTDILLNTLGVIIAIWFIRIHARSYA